jgi:hypothetical protein
VSRLPFLRLKPPPLPDEVQGRRWGGIVGLSASMICDFFFPGTGIFVIGPLIAVGRATGKNVGHRSHVRRKLYGSDNDRFKAHTDEINQHYEMHVSAAAELDPERRQQVLEAALRTRTRNARKLELDFERGRGPFAHGDSQPMPSAKLVQLRGKDSPPALREASGGDLDDE